MLGLSASFKSKLTEIEQEIAVVNELLWQAESSKRLTAITEQPVTDYLHSFKDIVVNRDMQQLRHVLEYLVEKVVVGKEDVPVVFKLAVPDGYGQLCPYKQWQPKGAEN